MFIIHQRMISEKELANQEMITRWGPPDMFVRL